MPLCLCDCVIVSFCDCVLVRLGSAIKVWALDLFLWNDWAIKGDGYIAIQYIFAIHRASFSAVTLVLKIICDIFIFFFGLFTAEMVI